RDRNRVGARDRAHRGFTAGDACRQTSGGYSYSCDLIAPRFPDQLVAGVSLGSPQDLQRRRSQVLTLRTEKIARRLVPMLNVLRSVPAKTRFRPLVVARRYPAPLVMRLPFLGLLPAIVTAFDMFVGPPFGVASAYRAVAAGPTAACPHPCIDTEQLRACGRSCRSRWTAGTSTSVRRTVAHQSIPRQRTAVLPPECLDVDRLSVARTFRIRKRAPLFRQPGCLLLA